MGEKKRRRRKEGESFYWTGKAEEMVKYSTCEGGGGGMLENPSVTAKGRKMCPKYVNKRGYKSERWNGRRRKKKSQ